ncbi:unnamed protein product [Dibothriocephalus latus]|uniref:Uncharacterized protein n=1 Tax=Dibothriocephalus latus TaxID=60516 RepID=A0A3P7LUU0_DIBLA|nr:unnamed protein product [Dibothriocephalus latus]
MSAFYYLLERKLNMTTGVPVPKLLHPLINRFEGEVDGGTCAPFQRLISLPREVESCQWRSSFKVLRPPDLTSLSNSTAFQLPRLLSPQQIHCLNSVAGCRIPDTTKKPPEIPLLRSQSASVPIAPRLELLKYDFITGPDNRPATVKEPTILRLPPSAFASFVPPEQSFSSKSSLNREQTASTVMQEVSVQVEESLGPTQRNALAKEGDHLQAPPTCVAGNGPLVDKSSQCSPRKCKSEKEERIKEEEQKTPLFEIKDNPQETPVLQPQGLGSRNRRIHWKIELVGNLGAFKADTFAQKDVGNKDKSAKVFSNSLTCYAPGVVEWLIQ